MADRYQPLEEQGGVGGESVPIRSNPMEKVRVRLAAESYNGAYSTMMGPEEPAATDKYGIHG